MYFVGLLRYQLPGLEMHREFIYDCNHRERKPVVKNIGLHIVFRLPVIWDRVQSITIVKLVVENIGFEFGIVFLSSVQAEIHIFPIWAAAIMCSDFR